MQLEPFEYRYIHFPVLPVIETGEVTVVITAYTFFDADRDERTIEVKVGTKTFQNNED